jgi:hypothetical protein
VSIDKQMTTWRALITQALAEHGESWADVEACTLTDAALDRPFNAGFGHPEGEPFTLWTTHRVYFPGVWDGAEWVDSVPRHPNGEATEHVGGY